MNGEAGVYAFMGVRSDLLLIKGESGLGFISMVSALFTVGSVGPKK